MIRVRKLIINNANFIKFFNIQIVSILITVILGKFIAIHYKPENFGNYSLLSAIMAFFSASIVSPILQSYRYLFNTTNYLTLNNYFLSVFSFILILVLPLVIAIAYYYHLSNLVIVIISATLIFQTYLAIFAAGLNLKGKNDYYALIQMLLPISNLLILGLAVFVWDDETYQTLLLGVLFSQLVGCVMYFTSLKENMNISFLIPSKILSDEKLKVIKSFVKPLILLPVFSWIVVSGDKFLIKYFLDSHAVGIYSASYSIGSKVFISISGVLILWTNSTTYAKVSENIGAEALYLIVKNRIQKYFVAGAFLVLIMFLFSGLIGKILLSDQYKDGFYLIGLLAFSSLIMTCFYFWEQALYALGITKAVTIHYCFGALLNLGLNVIFIPIYGIFGAAIALLISSLGQYCVLVFLFKYFTKKSIQLKH